MSTFNRRQMLGLMGGIAAGSAIVGMTSPIAAAAAARSEATASAPETLKSLMYAVNGETMANAKYLAFADVADKEGHKEIAAIFRVIAEAEKRHSEEEFLIAQRLGQVTKPNVGKIMVGTTRENLQTAINGETGEYTKMYPEFVNIAEGEEVVDARLIFILAKLGEEVHARIYADLLQNIDNFDKEKYAQIHRCPECGNIMLGNRPDYCTVCAESGRKLVSYKIVA